MTFYKKPFIVAFTLATVLVVGQMNWSAEASTNHAGPQMNQGTMQEMMNGMGKMMQQCQGMMQNN